MKHVYNSKQKHTIATHCHTHTDIAIRCYSYWFMLPRRMIKPINMFGSAKTIMFDG